MRRRAIVLLGLLLCSGCASTPVLDKPNNSLDRAIRYQEITRGNDPFDISESSTGQFRGVPSEIEVDINSRIEITLKKDEVHLPQSILSQEEREAFSSKTATLQKALAKLADIVEARSKTLAAFEKTEGISFAEMASTQPYKDFRAARRESGNLELEFSKLSLWNNSTLGLSEEEADQLFEDPTYERVGQLLQVQLDSVQASVREAEAKAKRLAPKLMLYASLEKGKGNNNPIHLPEYDKFDQQEAKFIDSPMMDHADREAFLQRYQQTVSLANEAEKIRTGESYLRESLQRIGLSRLSKLAAEAEELEPLLKQDWSTLREQLGKELSSAGNAVQETAAKHGGTEFAAYSTAVTKAREALSSAPSVVEFKNLAGQAKALGNEWRRVNATTLVATLNKTTALAESSAGALKEARKLEEFRVALQPVIAPLQQHPSDFAAQAWTDLHEKLSEPKAFDRTRSLIDALAKLKQFMEHLQTELDFASTKPTATDPHVSQVLEVSWADAPNTRIALPLTPRAVDDRVHVRATLQLGTAEPLKSHAVFSVQHFGWHSTLAPSVVFAKPTRTYSSFDRDFKFAPAVAWLKTYYPRATDTGPLKALSRFSQFGFGLHAAFLDHDPQKEAEIGLGVAASFWKDRIVVGAGWNLMVNSHSYFYIGSNLIPILQALGYGKENATGKQP